MRRVYKNTALNIASQIIVMIIMFVAMPWIVRGLGDTSFAILSLVWSVVSYFTLWDWGIGRAVTKFVAERRAIGAERDIKEIVFVSFLVSSALGIIFSLLLLVFADRLSSVLFTVSGNYKLTVNFSLRLVAVFMPVMLLQGVLRGVLMGLDRFDLSNLVQVANGLLQWLGALILVLFHFGVLWVISYVLVSRLLTTIVLFEMTRNLTKWVALRGQLDIKLLRRVLAFGGWVMVSQVVSPILQYAERFVLSGLIATSIVTYYVVPYEATSKMLVLSVGLVSALYPAMSELHGVGGINTEFKQLFSQSERILVFAFLPIGALLTAFAPDILGIWMGKSFAVKGAPTFEILSIAFVISSVAQLPYTVLQAVGRPDLTGRVHLIELPVHFVMTFLLVRAFGLIGAASATLFRILLDATLLYFYSSRELGLKIGFLAGSLRRVVLPIFVLLAGVAAVFISHWGLLAKLSVISVSISGYLLLLFKLALDDNEKHIIRNLISGRLNV